MQKLKILIMIILCSNSGNTSFTTNGAKKIATIAKIIDNIVLVKIIFLVFSIYLAIITFIERPIESIAAIATIMLGIPCYYILLRVISKNN